MVLSWSVLLTVFYHFYQESLPNLEDAVTIASVTAATSSTMTPQLVTSRIIHVELEFYCPLHPGEDVFPSESLYPGGTRVIVHIRIKQVGED